MDAKGRFSEIIRSMPGSEIRELMKLAGRPGIITFGGGVPDSAYFPHREVLRILQDLDETQRAAAYQYGPTPGYPPLIGEVVAYLRGKGINCLPEEVIITTGAQQALHLLSRVFIDPGDTVLLENPSFIGGVNAFLSFRAAFAGVPVLEDGIDMPALEKAAAARRGRIKFLYVIPTFQNPSGIRYSREKREQVLGLAMKNDLLVVEDDPYRELYFDGEEGDYPPLKSLDRDGRVVYLGSFSKILAPGLRVGFAVADKAVKEKLELAKQSVDACSPFLSQVIAAEYLKRGYCAAYVAKMRKVYADKCASMLKALSAGLPGSVAFTKPRGGFFVWLTLPSGVSAKKLFALCVNKGVAFVTGAGFCVDDSADSHIRLSFSNSSIQEIEKGIDIICGVLKKEIK